MTIRILIVDDEPWARRRIASLLKRERDVEIIGESSTGTDAIAKIEAMAPDLVFLDVQMPGINGFEVIDAVGPEHMPLVIFATAHDKYALQAFDAHAFDYLLKPFDGQRFRSATERARKELERPRLTLQDQLRSLLESLRKTAPTYLNRIVVRSNGRVVFLKASEIDWIEASGNYLTLHVGARSHLVRMTMAALEPKLDPERFVRIHRSTIINLDRVQELQPWFRGEQILIMKDGTKLTVGRLFRNRLQDQSQR